MAVVSPIEHQYNSCVSSNSYNPQINVKLHSLKLNSANGDQRSLDNEYCDKKILNRNAVTREPGNPILYCIACCLLSLRNCSRRCCGHDIDNQL